MTLVLDLGRFAIESDPATSSTLPQEEAALYECMRLEGKDVSAYLVDGHFDWSHDASRRLPGSSSSSSSAAQGALVPLLERCGMDIALQAARFPDPRFPMLKLQPSVPKLHFFISPARIGRLLRVLKAVVPGKEEGQASPVEAQWLERADHKGYLRTLSWGGLGRSTGRWCRRYGVLYMGQLYLYEDDSSAKLADSLSIWTKHRCGRQCCSLKLYLVGTTHPAQTESRGVSEDLLFLQRGQDPSGGPRRRGARGRAVHGVRRPGARGRGLVHGTAPAGKRGAGRPLVPQAPDCAADDEGARGGDPGRGAALRVGRQLLCCLGFGCRRGAAGGAAAQPRQAGGPERAGPALGHCAAGRPAGGAGNLCQWPSPGRVVASQGEERAPLSRTAYI